MKNEQTIRTLSRELAETRKFRNWLSIEAVLRAKGYTKARAVLDDQLLRRELNLTCQGRSIFDL